MKRLFVVGALLLLMLGLKALEVDGSGAADPLTLAAIGFVILAAFAVAELLAKASLPKITGYILSGILLGPYVGDVLTTDVVVQMGMFKTLAIGLIALTAGLELEIKALAKLARTLLATTGAKILIVAPLVGATLVGIELAFHPLGFDETAKVLGIALVFAALALGTSPSVTVAIVSESGAKGRLSDLVLGAAVLKDLVVVVALAIAIAVAKALTGGGSVGVEVLIHVGEELGGSVAAGAVVGLLLIAYMRWIQAEMLLFVAAIVLVGAEFAAALHLELLLIFIVAGFTVRNFSHYEHDLMPPLEMVSLPVFIVFFTTAGAAIDVGATWQVLPVALVLVLVRAGSYWVSAKIGNRIGNEAPPVADNAWYAYLPQAGVTLGLVGIAASKLEILASEIFTLGMACVAINLLAGPLLLRTGLARAGELPREDEAPSEAAEQPSSTDAAAPALVPLDPLSAELQHRLDLLRDQVGAELERGVRRLIAPWIGLRRRALAHIDPSSVQEITALAESPPRSDTKALVNELAALFEQAANHPQRLEITRRVPLEPRWLEPDAKLGTLRSMRRVLRRVAVTLGSRRAKTRELPMRLIAREAYEPRLATGMLELFRASCRTEAAIADVLRRRLEGSLDTEQVGELLRATLDDFHGQTAALIQGMLDAGSRRMHLLLARIDSPAMPISELDFSEAAAGIERELEALLSEGEQWPQVIDACWQTVEVSARIRRLDERIASRREGVTELRDTQTTIDEELGGFTRRLRALRDALDDKESLAEDELDAIMTRARALLPKPATKRLRQAEQRLRRSSDSKLIQQALREAASRDTGAKSLVGPELVMAAPIPAALRGRELDVHELIDGEIAGRLLPATEREFEAVARIVSEAQQAASTMVGDVELLIEVYRGAESKDATLDNLRAGLERVQLHGEQLHKETIEGLASAATSIENAFDGLGERLAAALHDATGSGDPTRWVSRRTDRARRQVWRELARLRERAEQLWATLRERWARLAMALSTDYRMRSGLALPSATAIAKLLEADNALRVGSEYATLFADQPIRDPRFFVANREMLRAISRAERNWQQQRSANSTLIIGGPGSGKTSLLNVATLKLATRDVIWLADERVDVIDTLAGELHCTPDHDAVLRRLLERARVIVIDDLEHRLPPGPGAIAALERLAQLMSESSPSCFWLVTASTQLQRLLARNWPLRVAFAEILELDDLDADTLASVILARHRISHLELSFPLTTARRLASRVLDRELPGQQQQYFDTLARATGSNLRAALTHWCRAAIVREGTLVLDPSVRARSLPFVRQLPATALAMLATVLRFGPCRSETVAGALMQSGEQLERWVHFLVTAELLARDGRGRLLCPAHVRDVLIDELGELGVLHKEGERG